MTGNHPEEFRELATLAVLNALEGEEAARFARHLQGCEVCRTTMEDDRQTFAQLDESVIGMEPSPGFRERLLARAAAERHTAAPPANVALSSRLQPVDRAIVLPFPEVDPNRSNGLRTTESAPRRGSRAPWYLAIAASLALAVGLGTVVGQQSYANQVLVAVPLTGEQVPGQAMLTVHRSGTTELAVNQLNDPPAGKVYVFWVIPPGGTPVNAGAVMKGNQTISISQPVLGTTVAITTEDNPGSPVPTTKPFLTAKVVA